MNLHWLYDLLHILLELKQLSRVRFFITGRIDVLIQACPVTLDLLQTQSLRWVFRQILGPLPAQEGLAANTHSSARLQTCLWKIYLCNRAPMASAAAGEREEEGKIRWKHFLLPRYWHQAGKRYFASCCRRENSSDSGGPNNSLVLSLSAVGACLDPNKEVILSKAEHWVVTFKNMH